MIPVKLSINNFLSYHNESPVLDFEDIHIACLCGDNGHGKSAILDAITWALWGTARARVQEDLIFQGETEMKVDLEFKARDDRYRVVRRYARPAKARQGATFLELFSGSEDGFHAITGNSVRETETMISSLLRMDYETFINSAFILQGKADMFTTSTPSKRKEILGEILGLSWYDNLADKARSIAREKSTAVRILQGEITSIDTELERKTEYENALTTTTIELQNVDSEVQKGENLLERLQTDINKLQLDHQQLLNLLDEERRDNEAIGVLENEIKEEKGRLEELSTKADGLQNLENELSNVTKEIQNAVMPSNEIQAHKNHLLTLQTELTRLESNNIELKSDMDELRLKVDLLKETRDTGGTDGECPLCGQNLGVHGYEHLAGIYQTQGQEKAQTYRNNDITIKSIETERSDIEQNLSLMETESAKTRRNQEEHRHSLFRSIEEAQVAVTLISDINAKLSSDELQLVNLRQKLTKLSNAIHSMQDKFVDMPALTNTYENEKSNLAVSRKRQNLLIANRGLLQGHLERCQELEERKDERVTTLEFESNQQGIHDQLSVAFGKGGIQALLIEQAMPELEDQANELLGRVTHHRMSMKLETQRETRGGGTPRETLDIKISDELGTRNYETYSGGEAFRINFSLRVALSKLLAHRSGAPLPTLFIDEGFGTQDSAGLELLVSAINTIQNEFQKIIVITHIEELKDAFPVRIEVSKTPLGSTFSVT